MREEEGRGGGLGTSNQNGSVETCVGETSNQDRSVETCVGETSNQDRSVETYVGETSNQDRSVETYVGETSNQIFLWRLMWEKLATKSFCGVLCGRN